MVKFERAELFLRDLAGLSSEGQLSDALAEISREMGFHHFALTHHVDVRRSARTAIRLHNYPADWAQYYDENRLGLSDPVHRASHVTSVGFTWSQIPQLIALTRRDHDILARGVDQGIGDGFTVPAHVPGESNGSCSFANPVNWPIQSDDLPLAQLVGSFAFEAARRLWRLRSPGELTGEPLTDRQRECIIWVARGKTDWEISRILGISHETVIRHLKQARERYGVTKRTMLAVHALFDGSISFFDIFRR
ncbi:LuxR family transcriptional regulator [Sphingosinicella sp. CPCC 101087]|uniref:LuxR family transcriptional regulator n=1 Tax=Sphingosinicella sp. CPCC 101087 TaxID=2497754 RepID=UPI00101DAF08|nr:LuxR family transcriptional regulator [Sphingosinicella sp. CPCC 101087]